MKSMKQVLSAAAFTLLASSANASIINFIELTEDAAGLGESAWGNLHIDAGGVGVDIKGESINDGGAAKDAGGNSLYDNDDDQFAYLDWGNAGLGVCKDASNIDVASPGSGKNRCNPGSDDNVTVGEYLSFMFDHDVVVENLWFNNNHDGGFGAGDQVTIDGVDFDAKRGYAGDDNGIGSFFVAANTAFNVAFNNEEFYISAMEINAVIEPSPFALFGLGLLGLGLARRRQVAA
jgi:hypothetical protein